MSFIITYFNGQFKKKNTYTYTKVFFNENTFCLFFLSQRINSGKDGFDIIIVC